MTIGQGVVSATNQLNPASATPASFAMGPNGDQYVSQLHGRYFAMARQGAIFTSYCPTVATSLVATAALGNIVWNPPGSGVVLVMLKWTSQLVANAASCTGIAIAGGYQTATPPATIAATTFGNTFASAVTRTVGKALAFASTTVAVAGVIIQVLHHNTAAINTVGMEMISGDLEGSIVVPEGGFVHMCALGAAAAASSHTSSLMWEEIATR
jgi:hypothetical protein